MGLMHPETCGATEVLAKSAQKCDSISKCVANDDEQAYLAKVAQVSQDLHNLEGGGAVQTSADFIHEENILGAAHHLAWTPSTTQTVRYESTAKVQAARMPKQNNVEQ